MSKVTNKFGELKVVPNTEVLEDQLALEHLSIEELLQRILLENIRQTVHLEAITEETIREQDLPRRK